MFIPRDLVESAKNHVTERRNVSRTGRRQAARVPDGSIDECEKSHHAARNRGDESTKGLFASKGLMAMVCRHDIPLFLCDITTSGEQQFYAIALIEQLAGFLPPISTIGVLYDIACTLDRAIAKHNLIPDIASRLSCGTAVFHAYAHQFCCQIVYHPRKRTGFGWSNGEGNERIWALNKDTIGAERIMGHHKRLFTLYRKYEYIATMKRNRLGAWTQRTKRAIAEAKTSAESVLKKMESDWTVQQLREQWSIQQDTQLSTKACNTSMFLFFYRILLDIMFPPDNAQVDRRTWRP
ncbi:hypothetical protein K439DRAFT_1359241 [Ramaria rubella]|nr:hypothetical protein K439DRAFT_1359241 [Ramaria rubella]